MLKSKSMTGKVERYLLFSKGSVSGVNCIVEDALVMLFYPTKITENKQS